MCLRAYCEEVIVPIDTAALSIWVDFLWFTPHGGTILSKGVSACAGDGREIGVVGTAKMDFELWGVQFSERMRLISTLPDRVLIGQTFWRKFGLNLDLEQLLASIRYDRERVVGRLESREVKGEDDGDYPSSEAVRAIIEDADVDQALRARKSREVHFFETQRNGPHGFFEQCVKAHFVAEAIMA